MASPVKLPKMARLVLFVTDFLKSLVTLTSVLHLEKTFNQLSKVVLLHCLVTCASERCAGILHLLLKHLLRDNKEEEVNPHVQGNYLTNLF